MLEVAQTKAENTGYAERRAQEMANGDMMEDYSLEGKVVARYTNLNHRFPYHQRHLINVVVHCVRGGHPRDGGSP